MHGTTVKKKSYYVKLL